ncbi:MULTISPECIES: ROK family protein [unclassified Curtobacterium]|uniref:ROK family protein n=1 Tax=unclassified Curtobacterium TaxID=257496 RepID=UPI00227407FE|nr:MULTISPECIES: ROK family protein [unclassified Curtobacterium]MCY1693029.1 ROK family protein [Curtobacterium sp. SL109]
MAAVKTVSPRDRALEDVYDRIRLAPEGVSRSELAAASSMSRSGVAYLVQRLLREGRVIEKQSDGQGRGSGSGRPAVRLFPAPAAGWIAGIDFGHKHIYVALADALGNEIASENTLQNVDLNAQGAMDTACSILMTLCQKNGVETLDAIVAGVPGPIDSQRGVVRSPTILSGWVGLDPAAELEQRLGQSVIVENDAVLGAIGEYRVGAASGHDDVLYVKLSDGIGAAMILDGRVYKGSAGLAGEIGHNRLENNNELCRCGSRGCLEAVISVDSVLAQLAHSHEGVEIPDIDDLPFDDEVTERIFSDAGRTVGQALSTLCNLINPSLLVVGGKLGTANQALLTGIKLGLDQFAQPATAQGLSIVAAQHGCRAELAGALQLAARPTF